VPLVPDYFLNLQLAGQTIMDAATVVAKMCGEEFTAADFQAVCRNRGFSVKAAGSPKLLENLLLSETGLNAALKALTRDEVVLLHLLRSHSQPVDLPFFHRVYGAGEHAWTRTFTEKYKETFKKVRATLIRRGVLFFADRGEDSVARKPKLERLLFLFPAEFQPLLPPLFTEVLKTPGPGDVNDSVIRGKLMELLGTSQSGLPLSAEKAGAFSIEAGELQFDRKKLRTEHLFRWQRAAWAEHLPGFEEKRKVPPWSKGDVLHWSMGIVEAVMYAASELQPGEWFEPASLASILKVFCHGRYMRDSDEFRHEVCDLGWRWGCLAKAEVGGRTCYGSSEGTEAVMQPKGWFLPDSRDGVAVDPARIPLHGIEEVARVSRFAAAQASLHARPDPVKIGRIIRSVDREPVALWLRENVAAFGRAFEDAEKKWGKQVVHENLLIAEVQDLSLRVSIEKAFSQRGLVSLPNGFMAFPQALRPEIEALVLKNGYVVKTMRGNDHA
jgi:hypothetical protein